MILAAAGFRGLLLPPSLGRSTDEEEAEADTPVEEVEEGGNESIGMTEYNAKPSKIRGSNPR